jgi:hypothetical protein
VQRILWDSRIHAGFPNWVTESQSKTGPLIKEGFARKSQAPTSPKIRAQDWIGVEWVGEKRNDAHVPRESDFFDSCVRAVFHSFIKWFTRAGGRAGCLLKSPFEDDFGMRYRPPNCAENGSELNYMLQNRHIRGGLGSFPGLVAWVHGTGGRR